LPSLTSPTPWTRAGRRGSEGADRLGSLDRPFSLKTSLQHRDYAHRLERRRSQTRGSQLGRVSFRVVRVTLAITPLPASNLLPRRSPTARISRVSPSSPPGKCTEGIPAMCRHPIRRTKRTGRPSWRQGGVSVSYSPKVTGKRVTILPMELQRGLRTPDFPELPRHRLENDRFGQRLARLAPARQRRSH
jgi:hypothetical protein